MNTYAYLFSFLIRFAHPSRMSKFYLNHNKKSKFIMKFTYNGVFDLNHKKNNKFKNKHINHAVANAFKITPTIDNSTVFLKNDEGDYIVEDEYEYLFKIHNIEIDFSTESCITSSITPKKRRLLRLCN